MKPIDVMRFRSLGAVVATVDVAASSAAASPTVTAQVTFATDGTYTDGDSGNWYLPTTPNIGNSYEIKLDITSSFLSGGATVGTYGSWLALSSDRTFGVLRSSSSPGTNSVSGNLSIRIGGVTVVTGTFSFDAEIT
jgi:hypothetical protein